MEMSKELILLTLQACIEVSKCSAQCTEGGESCTQSPQHIRSVNRCYNAKYQFIIGNLRIFAEIKETKCVLFLDFKTGYNNKSNKIYLQFAKGE